MLNKSAQKTLKKAFPIATIVIIVFVVAFIMLKYEVEGEKNMPFQLSKISIISTAYGTPNVETTDKWNLNLVQNNDIYFTFEKNKNFSGNAYIKKIVLENIRIVNKPIKGDPYFYMPSKESADWYDNNMQYRIQNKIEYLGTSEANVKELKIGNQGGIIGIRYAIENLGTYISQEDEIKHDGFLLKSIGIKEEDLKSTIEFDLVIELNTGIKYNTHLIKELPNSNVLEEGISKQEDTDVGKIVFKRI